MTLDSQARRTLFLDATRRESVDGTPLVHPGAITARNSRASRWYTCKVLINSIARRAHLP